MTQVNIRVRAGRRKQTPRQTVTNAFSLTPDRRRES